MTSSAITLDKELGGKPLTEKLINSLTPAQAITLEIIGDFNEKMVELCKEAEQAERTLARPQIGLEDYTERTVAGIVSDTFEIKKAQIREKMQKLLREAIDIGLGNLALVQRMCQRYGLSDYIRRKLQQGG